MIPLNELMKSQNATHNTFVDVPQHLLYISGVLDKARVVVPKEVFAAVKFQDFNFSGWDLGELVCNDPKRFVGMCAEHVGG